MQGWQVFFEIPGKPPVELREGESIIGRSRSSTVHIPETTVSRQHARVVVHPDGKVEVSDLGSSNGTFVNGEKVVGEKQIQEGDRLLVGDAELLLRVLAPAEPSDATVRVSIPGAGPIPEATVRQELPPPAPGSPPPPPAAAPAPPPPEPAAVAAPAGPVTAPTTPPAPPPAPAAPEPPRPSGEVLSSLADLDRMTTPPAPIAKSAIAAAAPGSAPAAGAARPAGFWIRCVAYLIDAVPFFVLWLVAVVVPFISEKLAIVSFLMMLLMLGWSFLLLLYWPATQGTTFGKKRLGLAIVTDGTSPGQGLGWGKAFVRLLGYMVNSLTGGIGYLLIAFTSKKQGLHDMIAGTYVVRTR